MQLYIMLSKDGQFNDWSWLVGVLGSDEVATCFASQNFQTYDIVK